jgi:hypothetical protein
MGDKPMLAFLKTTFQTCLIQGTSAQESGLKVSAEKQRDETIETFRRLFARAISSVSCVLLRA